MSPDSVAIDAIANILCEPEWDVAALEWIADIIGEVRPHPGGHETRAEYAELFAEETGRDIIEVEL